MRLGPTYEYATPEDDIVIIIINIISIIIIIIIIIITHPVDVQGRAELCVCLRGGRDRGEEGQPVLLISESQKLLRSDLYMETPR